MKIKEIREEWGDCRQYYAIYINDECAISFHDGEPEDNNLMRNFSDVYKIVELMKDVYEAGRKGEILEFE